MFSCNIYLFILSYFYVSVLVAIVEISELLLFLLQFAVFSWIILVFMCVWERGGGGNT